MRIERVGENTGVSKEERGALLKDAITEKLQGPGAKIAYSWEEDVHVNLVNITSKDQSLHVHMRNEKNVHVGNQITLHWLDKKHRQAGEFTLNPDTNEEVEALMIGGATISEQQWDGYVDEWEKTAGVVEGFWLIQPKEMDALEKDALVEEIKLAQSNPDTTEKALRYMEVYLEFERKE